jgi:hypothetical protein
VTTLLKVFSKQPDKELLHIVVEAQGPPAPTGELSVNIATLSIHIDGGLIRIFWTTPRQAQLPSLERRTQLNL